MTGLWIGQYWYPEPWEPPCSFIATLSDNQGSLSGSTSEASDLLAGADERADVRGTRSGTAVSFYKYYDGDAAYGHAVAYEGILSTDGQQVDGHWSIDDYSGGFVMTRSLQAVQAGEEEAEARMDAIIN
ncbi:hypothetical protein [Sphingopyxis sp.]|jgi:hypothetical protein|uniref:hypothetical protein n=1 Tax=Sphingopyxis sp. TaxID=1908224 RepID=UPI0025F3BAF6|nr:hypothetical protein [Sphingopyxis sp.]MBK6414442.1 hypothetical protein [Sphingopyxis sp.]